ncbi:class F sortase [Blastococcus saxobsidens]|uniref:class F sortase n=1 Tax=Blastococcus saxobsidens TaxID=138336 RepID=UPI0013155CAD|nr:class F sortase [Blastococcus saxobsidens]
MSALVTADPLTEAGDLFVPADPRVVSWAEEDAAPGAARGTAILVGHINSVVDGELVRGALSDLAEYAVEHVGEEFTVVLADGRELAYRITGGEQYDKDELAARPELRAALYDQQSAFGPAPGTGRLVLVSCGGAFDRTTGSYEDNVFLYALPVGTGTSASHEPATVGFR